MIQEQDLRKGAENHQSEQLDPLSITHILNQTIQHCSVETLRNLRLVSKEWNTSATKFLRQNSDPILFTDEFYDLEKMQKIVKIMKHSVISPCVKFCIASSFLTQENQRLIMDFFNICSPFMEHLTICIDRNQNSIIAQVFLNQVNLPKLKSLVFEDHTSLRNGTIESMNNHDGFNSFFKALLFAASNLERLNLSIPKGFFEADYEDNVVQIPQLPEGIICSRSSQQLKHLEISAKLTDNQLICLSQSGLILHTLHFRVRNVSLMDTSFTTLLQNQSDTLVELKLTEERHGSNFLVKFPRMKRLAKITISSICEFENTSLTFAPFGYQEVLPKMETLILWNSFGKEERWTQFLHAESPSLTIKRLELPAQFRNPTLAHKISHSFPFLKRLKIGFSLRPENESVLKIIFQSLTTLEELDIRTDMDNQNENIDHVLTGISKDLCKKIRKNESYNIPNSLETLERGPSIKDLKNLRRLEIIMDNSRAPFVTDVTGYLGFMQMAKLKVLRFTRYGMSQECVAALKEKFEIHLVPPRCGNFFEIEYLNLDFD